MKRMVTAFFRDKLAPLGRRFLDEMVRPAPSFAALVSFLMILFLTWWVGSISVKMTNLFASGWNRFDLHARTMIEINARIDEVGVLMAKLASVADRHFAITEWQNTKLMALEAGKPSDSKALESLIAEAKAERKVLNEESNRIKEDVLNAKNEIIKMKDELYEKSMSTDTWVRERLEAERSNSYALWAFVVPIFLWLFPSVRRVIKGKT